MLDVIEDVVTAVLLLLLHGKSLNNDNNIAVNITINMRHRH